MNTDTVPKQESQASSTIQIKSEAKDGVWKIKQISHWQLSRSKSLELTSGDAIKATVPGAVQLDWASAHNLPSYLSSSSLEHYQGLEDFYWHYAVQLDFSDTDSSSRIRFKCAGIDYAYSIFWCEQHLVTNEGMQSPIDLELPWSKEGQLRIVVHPAPKVGPDWSSHHEASESFKPAVSYGWDFHPRLIPLGIHREALIGVFPENVPDISLSAHTELHDSLEKGKAIFEVSSDISIEHGDVVLTIFDTTGSTVAQIKENGCSIGTNRTFEIEINDVELWWPHHLGSASRYSYKLSIALPGLGEVFCDEGKVAFRKVELKHNAHAWHEPSSFPQTRSVAPMQWVINGKETFIKGTNWCPVDVFPSKHNRKTYEQLLSYAKQANLNMIRCWGGGPVNLPDFFDLCDEMGIMVWQDFTLSCNNYPDTKALLETADRESRNIIKRLRSHPSVVLWCGGNELFNSWSGMGDQSRIVRQINANCLELDPKTPFIATAPLFGMAHGPYTFRDHQKREIYACIGESKCTAYTEFGIASPSSVETIEKLVPEDLRWPPQNVGAWREHFGYQAWDVIPDAWLTPSMLEHYFGQAQSLEELVNQGQRLQYEGLRFVYEEARRQQPHCSMALNWCFNEPWPTIANCSVVEYSGKPKRGLRAITDACRPICPSLAIEKYSYSAGETLRLNPWLLNDSDETIKKTTVEVELSIGEWTNMTTVKLNKCEDSKNLRGPTVSFKLPKSIGGSVEDILISITYLGIKEDTTLTSSYTLLFKQSEY